jgi:uncharacterized protein
VLDVLLNRAADEAIDRAFDRDARRASDDSGGGGRDGGHSGGSPQAPEAPPAAGGQSFSCSDARSAVEITVCRDSELQSLDRRVAELLDAGDARGLGPDWLQADHRRWLAGLRDSCGNSRSAARCIREQYLDRITWLERELEG